MAQIIKGKEIAQTLKLELKTEIEKLNEKNIFPSLAVIMVGDNPASKVYVANKQKFCKEIGIESFEFKFPAQTCEEEILNLIDRLNCRKEISGILVQLPLPEHLNSKNIIEHILPEKDVDAFSNINTGKIMQGHFEFLPCTPSGIMELLSHSNIDVKSKNCVVIGRSNIVGKPMAMLLLHNDATVTICHSKTQNLAKFTKQADIIIVAVGKPKFLTADMVNEGCIVIDVGINRNENNKLCGDVDFENVSKKAAYITPVPGGVGPMTVAMLMKNTIKAALLQN